MALLDGQFYYPSRRRYGAPEEFGLRYEAVQFESGGHRLHGWWFATRDAARGTVIHLHGNAGNITGHFAHVAWLAEAGYNVLCFDYRGYGESQGEVSRAGTIEDGHAAVNYLHSRRDADPRSVFLFGQSLGGAVAVVVAAQRQDLAGIVVDGAFSDYRQEVRWILGRRWYTRGVAGPLSRWGISRGLDPIDYVADVSPIPLLLMHGQADRICPWEMSQELYQRAREPKGIWLVPDMDHYQVLEERRDEARHTLLRFFEACLQAHAIDDPEGRGQDSGS